MIQAVRQKEKDVPASHKWGELANAGFQILPDIILKKQKELGLSATEMLVLINITMHWWYKEKKPFPHSRRIAKHMGVDTRTVQRALKKLEALSLIKKEKVHIDDEYEQIVYNLDGLITKLTPDALNDLGYRPRFVTPNLESNNETPI